MLKDLFEGLVHMVGSFFAGMIYLFGFLAVCIGLVKFMRRMER